MCCVGIIGRYWQWGLSESIGSWEIDDEAWLNDDPGFIYRGFGILREPLRRLCNNCETEHMVTKALETIEKGSSKGEDGCSHQKEPHEMRHSIFSIFGDLYLIGRRNKMLRSQRSNEGRHPPPIIMFFLSVLF
jgi:hypothetical protein